MSIWFAKGFLTIAAVFGFVAVVNCFEYDSESKGNILLYGITATVFFIIGLSILNYWS